MTENLKELQNNVISAMQLDYQTVGDAVNSSQTYNTLFTPRTNAEQFNQYVTNSQITP
jgi:hypothetical protein